MYEAEDNPNPGAVVALAGVGLMVAAGIWWWSQQGEEEEELGSSLPLTGTPGEQAIAAVQQFLVSKGRDPSGLNFQARRGEKGRAEVRTRSPAGRVIVFEVKNGKVRRKPTETASTTTASGTVGSGASAPEGVRDEDVSTKHEGKADAAWAAAGASLRQKLA